ncbi:MAG: hypothetical protein ABEK12_02630 [Candidatus Nanohaloarchaea archaeon]
MQVPDIDRNVKYLVVTVLLLLPVAAAHNLAVRPTRYDSFAMCDTTIACQGVDAGVCLGIESRSASCMDFRDAPQHRRVEAECGLDAQAICNANPGMSGTDWTDHPNATYNGTSCATWAEQDDRITLMRCEDTFDSINQWSGHDE